MSYLKYLFISSLITISFAIIAEDDVVKKPKKTIDFKAEQEMVVAEINEKRVEDQLIKNNPNLEACQKDTTIPVEDCLKSQIGSMSEDEIEKLSKKLDLPSYDKKASKDSDTIRDYLTERIEFALRGRPKGKKGKELSIKELKFVDHSNYNKIYRSQIGKNLLLEVTNYCLTNFGVKGIPEVLASQCLVKPNDGSCAVSATGSAKVKVIKDSNGKYSAAPLTAAEMTSYSTNFWKEHAYEYRLCDKMKASSKAQAIPGNNQTTDCASGPDALSTPTKTTDLITAIKEAEFKAGAVFLKAKVGFCTHTVVKNMCEKYRCNHVYTSESDISGEKLKYCQTELEINVRGTFPTRANRVATAASAGRANPPIYYKVEGSPTVIDVSGIKACGLVTRLKEYRRVIVALNETDKFYKANKDQARGLSIGDSKAFKGQYQGGKDKSEQSIEEITTISSKEFAEIALSDAENLEELKEKCFENNVLNTTDKDCEALVKNEIEDGTAKNLNSEMTAETEVYLKRLKDLADNDDTDSINEYLKKHGLDKHIGSSLTSEQLKNLISDQYKSERASLKHNMMEKFNRLTKKPTANNQTSAAATDAEILEIAQDTISSMENQSDRIETMVQYNNIITSYLEAGFDTNGDGKADGDKVSLTYQRDIEMNKFKELSKDSDAAQTASDYETYFDDQQGDTPSTANSSLSIDIDFIDGLLGNK
jgi:hypothetical protein